MLDEYSEFSKKFKLPEQRERIYYDLRGRVAPSQRTYKKWQGEQAQKEARRKAEKERKANRAMQDKAEMQRRADMDKAAKSGIINKTVTKEGSIMGEARLLGNINISVLERAFGKIQTSETIVTSERISHIKERHLIDYELFEVYGAECIQNPDYIIKDNKNEGTVFMVKKLPDTNLNVVSRLALDSDKSGLKNSVMTFYRIRERNLKKLIEKNQLLYKKE